MIGTYDTDRKEIYFELNNHDLITGTKLRFMMYVIGDVPEYWNVSDTELRKFAKNCKGILRELEKPSVVDLIKYGFKSTAIQVYYKETPNVSLLDAKKYIDELALKMGRS